MLTILWVNYPFKQTKWLEKFICHQKEVAFTATSIYDILIKTKLHGELYACMYEGNHNKIVQLIDRNTCLILNKIEDRFVTVKNGKLMEQLL